MINLGRFQIWDNLRAPQSGWFMIYIKENSIKWAKMMKHGYFWGPPSLGNLHIWTITIHCGPLLSTCHGLQKRKTLIAQGDSTWMSIQFNTLGFEDWEAFIASCNRRSSLTSKPLLCDCLAKRDPYGAPAETPSSSDGSWLKSEWFV